MICSTRPISKCKYADMLSEIMKNVDFVRFFRIYLVYCQLLNHLLLWHEANALYNSKANVSFFHMIHVFWSGVFHKKYCDVSKFLPTKILLSKSNKNFKPLLQRNLIRQPFCYVGTCILICQADVCRNSAFFCTASIFGMVVGKITRFHVSTSKEAFHETGELGTGYPEVPYET